MKCIIIGLGTYGRVMVDELSALGHEVIAADSDASRVERVKDICDAAFQIDASDELALGVLPLKKVDVVIVAIGSNLGASVRVVALLKKLGVKSIYARANDYVHKSILQAFDIEKILIPEERAARSLVRQMDLGVKTDLFRIDDNYCVYKFRIPEKLSLEDHRREEEGEVAEFPGYRIQCVGGSEYHGRRGSASGTRRRAGVLR